MRDTSDRRRAGRYGAILRGENVPVRVHKVSRTTVVCPDCHAEIGERCRTSGSAHASRIRLTNRVYTEEHPIPLSRVALTLYGPHALSGADPVGTALTLTTLCGVKVGYNLALSRGRIHAGIAADVRCPGCLAALPASNTSVLQSDKKEAT